MKRRSSVAPASKIGMMFGSSIDAARFD